MAEKEKRCVVCGKRLLGYRKASRMRTCKACGGLFEKGYGFGKVVKKE